MPNPLAWLSRDSRRFVIRGLKARFRDQKVEFRLIRQHVKPADTVCDIGANKGSFVFWLSLWCPQGQVVAFEPQPALAGSLRQLTRRLGLANVSVEQKAVFSRTGQADLFVPRGHLPSASLLANVAESDLLEKISVPVVRLDDYFGKDRRIAFMKVDVEGAELDAFKGAERILREQSPLLIFECEDRHLKGSRMSDVFAYLRALGYAGSFVAGDRLRPISEFDLAVHQKRHGKWFWKAKNYYPNFVFSKTPFESDPSRPA